MKTPAPYGLTDEFYKNLRKNCQIYANASEKLKKKEYIPTYFMNLGEYYLIRLFILNISDDGKKKMRSL